MSIGLLRRILSKPLPVILFRLKQSVTLSIMDWCGIWSILSSGLERSTQSGNKGLRETVVLSGVKPSLNGAQRQALTNLTKSVLESSFRIFGQVAPDLSVCDFSSDWRFDHRWRQQYFKKYKFYEYRSVPYDVKFPWELSRLHYLIPVLAQQWVGETDVAALRRVHKLLVRWRSENPLAYSVNWYPMEASMRTVNLALMLDFVCVLSKDTVQEDAQLVLRDLEFHLRLMLEEHGAFVWANREFTDIRGNHFTANLVALLLAAQVSGSKSHRRRRWLAYALEWLDREVALQFCPDGVNFEKSCAYHKLVLELFLVAAIVRDNIGKPFSTRNLALLRKAAHFSDALTRPDGIGANFGDTDDAVVLPFNFECPRSHGPVVELARCYFDTDIGAVIFNDEYKLASLFILGRAMQPGRATREAEILPFLDGGYVVVRHQLRGFFIMMDIGEVGMAGRGGHGHNDLLSFELCISGKMMVVDPGCSGYTADLEKKSRYRSTASHSTIQLFGEEMARFAGHWAIRNDAVPFDVSVEVFDGGVSVSAAHTGYGRIANDCVVKRTFTIYPDQQVLQITDLVQTPVQATPASWHLPLGQATLLPANESERTRIESDGKQCFFEAPLPLKVIAAPFSDGYGQENDGQVIMMEASVQKGSCEYSFRFEAV